MNNLQLPAAILKQHLVVLGKTGSGKSSVLRVFVERLLSQGKRVVIIDPKGDWYGLKIGADGKSAGFPVIAFGEFKEPSARDVPINPQSGKHVAELIATGNRPAIIGFRGWMHAHMSQFWIDFASTLFNHNSGELFLVGDEFHNFAPKGKVLDPQAGKCLHWSNRLLSEGRGLGLICLIASQRPQKVHNDTLTCCETLIAMRVVHKADRDAVKDWIDGAGDREQGRRVLDEIAGLKRGDAYVWSPEAKFGPTLITFPMFKTFDSFAPPQLQKKITGRSWADVDLDVVKVRLAAVIEEHKANDPGELKRQISDLRRQLAAKSDATIVETKVVEVPVLKNGQLDRTEKALARGDAIVAKMAIELQALREQIKPAFNRSAASPSPRPVPLPSPVRLGTTKPITAKPNGRPSVASGVGDGTLPKGERTMLIAVAQYDGRCTREQLSMLTGFKRSTRDRYLQFVQAKGLAESVGDSFRITEVGLNAIGTFEQLPSGDALRAYWLNKLPSGEASILGAVCEAYPDAASRDLISKKTNFKRSTRDRYIQFLQARFLVTSDSQGVKASAELFD